ncbi:hypothetical protein D3C72_932320 [compost metagenome]
MLSGLGNAIHVQGRGAAVHSGDESTLQGVDKATKGFEQCRAVFHMGVANDHRFAAAQWQARQCRLVAHALGQAYGVDHGAVVVWIGQVSTAAHGRAQVFAVNGDHRFQAGCRVDAQVQRLRASTLHEREHQRAPQ